MIKFCQEHDIKLLTYGTLLGGLLSEKFLGVPEPSKNLLDTASLRRYKGWVDNWGGWSLFQELLRSLKEISDKHSVSIANVAIRYILDKPAVGCVIVGARLGISEHIQDNLRVFEFQLDSEDREKIEKVTKKGKVLPGEPGDEYR